MWSSPTPGRGRMCGLATHLVPDQELALQIVPFLLSLVAIPLMGRVVFTIVGHHGAALVAAALTALNPYLAAYSISTKPFTADFVVCCRVLAGGGRGRLGVRGSPTRRI